MRLADSDVNERGGILHSKRSTFTHSLDECVCSETNLNLGFEISPRPIIVC